MILSAWIGLLTLAQAARPTPGDFDQYVLSISYQNDFCLTHSAKSECQVALTEPKLSLHGLWPNQADDPNHHYQYCGELQELNTDQWCAPLSDIRPKLSCSTFSDLEQIMPGTQSCLYNHEWYAHGTCSGLSENDYFELSHRLTKEFITQASGFKKVLQESFGKSVPKQTLYDALSADFGNTITERITLRCRQKKSKGKTTQYFSELHVSLDPKTAGKVALTESLMPEDRSTDNCGKGEVVINSPSYQQAQDDSPKLRMQDDPTAVLNPCPCASNPGKSFCKSIGFGITPTGQVINYKTDGGQPVPGKTYSSVQEFIDQNVCK
jgi:ribonuclease T2